MKVYYIRIEDADFTKTLGSWESPEIDIYDNDTYKNYCTTRVGYGSNLLGDGTWTGLNATSPTESESGYVVGDRFVDTSGPAAVVSYTFEATPDIDGLVTYSLDVQTSVDDTNPTWATPALNIQPSDNIGLTNVDRYLKFVLRFENAVNFTFTGTLLVRVEIDAPVMAPLYRRTRRLLDKLPEWMAMREADSTAATPTTLGAAFINIAGGEWLEALASDLTYLDLQKHITTVDLNQVAWVWRKDQVANQVWEVIGDDTVLSQAFDLEEFYEAFEDEDIYFWEESTDTLYVRQEYSSLLVNGEAHTELSAHHVWNWIDDIGLLVDLDRIHLEDNTSFQLRILDVHRNRPGVGVENFKRTLRRELNIWSVYGSTPNSDYVGATPIVLEISDIEKDRTYVHPDGLPTDKFLKLAGRLAQDYPTTWGYFFWNKTFWDLGGPKHEGYATLPQRYDATPLLNADTQSGVGYGNDLYVYRPEAVTGPHQFNASLKIRGRERTWRTEYTPVTVDLEIYGQADKDIYTNTPISVPLTIELVVGGVTYYYNVTLSATNNASSSFPSGSSSAYTEFDIFSADGKTHLPFKHKVTGVSVLDQSTPYFIPFSAVTSMSIHSGHWTLGATPTYEDAVGTNIYQAWFHTTPGSAVNSTTAVATISPSTLEPRVILRNTVVNMTSGKWTSEKFNYSVTMNGALPDQTQQSYTLTMPTIAWPSQLHATPNLEYIVKIISHDGAATPTYGAYALDDDDDEFFIPASYVYAAGSNVWTSNQRSFLAATSTITFATGSGGDATPVYPIQGSLWTLFERSQVTPYVGIVDENGPWRNNVPSQVGNVNFGWKAAELARTDFNIPNTANFVPTWIGVEATDPQVIIWLDNNTIVPYDNTTTITYPANAVEEYKSGNLYGFESLMIRARLRPDPAPQWNPQINSGWFYEKQQEYYLYAARAEAVVTADDEVVLSGVAHQGAPIIVYTDEATPKLLRQVSFSDATPTLTFEQSQLIRGNGTENLYLAYPDVYDVSVIEHYSGDSVSADSSSSTNIIQLGLDSDVEKAYEVSYRVRNSFIAEMNYDDNNEQRTRLTFDDVGDYVVSYESSLFNPATPIDLPLSPLYTSVDEGFVFVSHNEYTLDAIRVYLSPPKVVANGTDYIQVSIRSLDRYGNPKADQSFSLSTSFGTLETSSVTTDRDGFATVRLTAGVVPPVDTLTGVVTVTGAVSATVNFEVALVTPAVDTILAVPSVEEIPADARSKVTIFGKLESTSFTPRANTRVYYRRGRSLFELFQQAFQGSVLTNSDGEFSVGPFTAATPTQPGFWFLSVETDPATPTRHVGDVVFWNEYPTTTYGIDDLSGLPRPAIQMATPVAAIPPYAVTYKFPQSYDEAATPVITSATPTWLPPKWYSMPWYLQYQLGLLGSTPNALAASYLTNARPPRREL